MQDSKDSENLDTTTTTVDSTLHDNQSNEELKRPRRVLKTHRKSVDDSKALTSLPPKKNENDVDEFDDSITTESLKEILNVTQSPTEHDDTEKQNNGQNYDDSSQKEEDADIDREIETSEQIRNIPPPQHEPTSTLHIKNFVRPLTLPMVRDLLEQFGRIEYFWMDKIKSHCYVKFETTESAISARETLWHIIFPPETGRPLELEFLTFERAQELIAEAEEKSAKSGNGALREARDKRLNGNSSLGTETATRFPIPSSQTQPISNVRVISLDTLFSKTSTKPTLYYKPVSQEDAQARMRIMERNNIFKDSIILSILNS
ncbi:apoptotic chromatin condensation inducer in the nucleus-like [Rhizophagus clarus]|uniref:Apoptotic chromatin condensation inducer in the nucleus-like n=1 Tax=Rhizophagus clarus TaxID=94130 RepID=A0A8H3QLB3_9GLOM|nr:apoptotic chromatin condensation inducer in the nucleus-like [Rhizophagus clarus]